MLTASLVIVNEALVKDAVHRSEKVELLLMKYWNDCPANAQFWKTLQSTHQCCGMNHYDEWGPSIPLSCYQIHKTWMTWRQTVTFFNPHENGCYSVLVNYFDGLAKAFNLIAMAFVSLGVSGIFGMLLVWCALARTRKEKSQTNSLAQVEIN